MKKYSIFMLAGFVALVLFYGEMRLGEGSAGDWNLRENPLLQLRLCRGMGAFFIGASLSLAGLICQVLFRNPLATPSTLGISSGAAAGAASVFLWCSGGALAVCVPCGALCGSLAALFLVLFFSRWGRRGAESLLLSGVIVGTIVSSLLVYLISIADSRELSGVTWWTLGDLQALYPPGVVLLAVGSLGILFYLRTQGNSLNALALGEEEARALGIRVDFLRTLLVILAALLASFCVALAGIITFVGLIVPHLVRRLFGCNLRYTIGMTYLAGGMFLTCCDLLSKACSSTRQMPIGVMTACLGGLLFLVLLHKGGQKA